MQTPVSAPQNFAGLTNAVSFFALIALLVLTGIPVSAATPDTDKTAAFKPFTPIPVAFVISDAAVVIDFCGPWEVFRDAMVPDVNDHPFTLYTVSDKTDPIRAGGGMKIVPDYTF